MKKSSLAWYSISLMVIFFIIGWLISKPLLAELTNYYLGLTTKAQIAALKMNEKFTIHLFSAISIGILPIIVWIVCLGLEKLKHKIIRLKTYIINIGIVLLGFLVGAIFKVGMLSILIKTLDTDLISPNVINTFQLRLIKFHDWGLITAFLSGVLIVIFTKKSKINNRN